MKMLLDVAETVIALALDRAGRTDAGPVLVVHMQPSAGGTGVALVLSTPHLEVGTGFTSPVDREVLPPGVADEIARAVVTHHDARDRIVRDAHAVASAFEALSTMLPAPVEIAREGSGAWPDAHQVRMETLSASLVRRTSIAQRVTPQSAAGVAAPLVERETVRAELLRQAGGRRAALRCCPVAAAAILADPGAWRDGVSRSLDDVGMTNFRDGVLTPNMRLGKGCRWKNGSLFLHQELPESARAALVGGALSRALEHPHLPRDATVTGTAQRIGAGECVIRTDAASVPLAPILDLLGLDA